MSPAQRARYFGKLWPAACERQGWPVNDAKRRREVTIEATGKDSTTGLDEDEISALFAELAWLADPSDLDLARAAAPEFAKAENRRRRWVYLLNQLGLSAEYIAAISVHKCRRHHVTGWQNLPEHDLRALLATARRRAKSFRKPL